MRRSTGLVGAILVALCATARADPPEEAAKETTPCEAALARLESEGFAVCPVETSLYGTYRFPRKTIFVTADSGLAAYLVALRTLLHHVHGGLDREAGPLVAAWHEAIPASAAAEVRRFVGLLLHLHGGRPHDADLPAIRREVDALRSGRTDRGFLDGEGAFDRGPLADLWIEGNIAGPARWQATLYLLTRAPVKAEAAADLRRTIPSALAASVKRHLAWIGAGDVDPDQVERVLGFRLHGDRRFPPGTAAKDPEAFGLDVGSRLGNDWAKSALAGREIARLVQPEGSPVTAGSLRADLLGVLRTVDARPEQAPALFRSTGWRALDLQAVLGADVLWRKAVGAASGAAKVFCDGEPAGFVDPNPAFWDALRLLAHRTALDVRTAGVSVWRPAREDVARLEVTVREKFEREEPFSAWERAMLADMGVGGWDAGFLERWGSVELREDDDRKKAFLREQVEKILFGERWGVFRPSSTEARPARVPFEVSLLERLAVLCGRFRAMAERQLAGRVTEDAVDAFSAYGFLLEDIVGAYAWEDPVDVATVVLEDVGPSLVHGVRGADELWVRYPWQGKTILCLGAVFSYREVVTADRIGDAAWRGARGDAARRPSWASTFLAR
jgi:hypothetical protein